MKIKLFVFMLIAMVLLTSCQQEIIDTPSADSSFSEEESSAELLSPVAGPYVLVEESESETQIKFIDWEHVLQTIPSEKYEQYPGLHSQPVTATLYKNGERIELDIHDLRLVQLMNFYHNEIYYNLYALSQGTVNSMYEEKANADFRLELTFVQNIGDGSFETTFDKMIVCDRYFIGVRTNIPFEDDSYSAYSRTPLFSFNGNWLEIFGF